MRGAAQQQPKGLKMITQTSEIKIVEAFRVACDGSEGALGHPRVWLQIPNDLGWVVCPYCDAKMVYKEFEGKV
jgi:uncharacterized Zn-finger protein|tara:strand:+ start:1257 stop:1475 length:219 start_codon:yes stop_codon:yes gene_type:complete